MKKILIPATVVLFMVNTTAMSGMPPTEAPKHNQSSSKTVLEGKSTKKILNEQVCKDKKVGEQVKNPTDGKMITCHVEDEGRFSEENTSEH